MATQIPRVPTQNALQYTLDSGISAGATSLTLNSSVAGIIRAPGYIVIDRVDSAGNKTPTTREYFKFTGVSGANLTGLTGGLAGSTQQTHNVGAIVELVPDVLYEQDWYASATTDHDTNFVHVSLASLTQVVSQNITVSSVLNASGATHQGVLSTVPVFTYVGNLSAATGIGTPLMMPRSGTINFITAAVRVAPNSASLQINILKNGTGIVGTLYPFMLSGTTFVSTASIATQTFVAGDVFTVINQTAASANGNDLTVMFHAR